MSLEGRLGFCVVAACAICQRLRDTGIDLCRPALAMSLPHRGFLTASNALLKTAWDTLLKPRGERYHGLPRIHSVVTLRVELARL